MKIKYLTQKETEKLFRTIKKLGNQRDYVMFRLIYWLGLRASEVGLLKREDFVDSTIYVHRLKGSLSHSYQLPKEISLLLHQYLRTHDDEFIFVSRNHKPISRSRLDQLFKKYSCKFSSDKQHCHVLRHSIAVHLVDSDMSIRKIAYHLGHSSINSTMIYADMSAKASEDIFLQMKNSQQIAS